MADATMFNLATGIEAVRKLLTTWVNVGTHALPEWECVGVGVEESSIEMNVDKSKTTDIQGTTRTKINKFEKVQTLDPMTVRGGSELQLKLYNQLRHDQLAEMSAYEVMVVYGFVGAAATFEAETYDACTISTTSLGGSAYVDMPIEIDFGGNKVLGTSSAYLPTATPVFTPTV